MDLDICAITETKLLGTDRMKFDDGIEFLYTGNVNLKQQGVGLVLKRNAIKSLVEWEPVSERILTARFQSRHGNISVLVCYAPTNEASDDSKDRFYEDLQNVINRISIHDIKLCVGDFNAIVGSDNSAFSTCMKNQGMGKINDNGIRMASFCLANNLVIGGSLFKHKNIHKYTWTSPNGKHRNQIDHFLISQKFVTSLTDVRTRRGADIGSDHQLVVAKLKLKLKTQKNVKQDKVNINELRYCKNKQEEFKWECRNQFTVLETIMEETDPEKMWNEIKHAMQQTTEKVIEKKKSKVRKKWISDETWNLIKKRSDLKKKSETSLHKNENEKENIRREYWHTNKKIKKSARRDKRRFIDEIAVKTEESMNRKEGKSMRIAYEGIKELIGEKRKNTETPIKDSEGNLLTKENDIKNRWKEHFEKILNRPIPERQNITPAETLLDIDTTEIRIEEVQRAIKQTKNHKAAGWDELFPEMFKMDEEILPITITRLFNRVFETGKVPLGWKKGIIIKIPKKGKLDECGNWRGITLTPIISKIFSKVLLNRFEEKLDKRLRDVQAGFRRNRGCADQIFTIRHIIQQVNEMKRKASFCFIDYEKAFDSVSREILPDILRHYGFPEKYVNVIYDMHMNTFCQVLVNGNLTEPFEVKSGLIQGGILSPVIFIMYIDFIFKKVLNEENNFGIKWNERKRLTDLDYADDIVLITENDREMQIMLNRINEEGLKVGLKINVKKTEMINVNLANATPCTINNENIKIVENFKYLGTNISQDGSLNIEFNDRINKANQVIGRLKPIWNNSNLSINTKLKVYTTMVKSVLIYGHESWYSTRTSDSKFLVFENKMLRRILDIRWQDHIRNSRIREITEVEPIDQYVRKSRWKWLGHVYRRNDYLCEVPNWEIEGRRSVGRPKETWLRTMKREVGTNNWDGDIKEMAQDRYWWREFIMALCSQWELQD